MDLNARIEVNFFMVDVNFQTVIVTNSATDFFILTIINIKVLLILHTKFQPNIPNHLGENAHIINFAIFSISSHLEFLTRLNFYYSEVLESDHDALEF